MAMRRSGGDDKSGGERDRQRTVGEMREDMKRVCGVVEHAIVVLTCAVDEGEGLGEGGDVSCGDLVGITNTPICGGFPYAIGRLTLRRVAHNKGPE